MSAYFKELGELLAKGGFVMPPLVAGAFVLWATIGYRFVLLFMMDSRSARRLVDEARAGTLKPRGVVAEAAVRAVEEAKKGHRYLRSQLDEIFVQYEQELSKFGALGRSIVQAAPLLGLLGTVSGMIDTFQALGDADGITPGGGVAGGISEALFSTQMGLIVAIPGLLVGRLLDRRQTVVEDELLKLKDIVTVAGTASESA